MCSQWSGERLLSAPLFQHSSFTKVRGIWSESDGRNLQVFPNRKKTLWLGYLKDLLQIVKVHSTYLSDIPCIFLDFIQWHIIYSPMFYYNCCCIVLALKLGECKRVCIAIIVWHGKRARGLYRVVQVIIILSCSAVHTWNEKYVLFLLHEKPPPVSYLVTLLSISPPSDG